MPSTLFYLGPEHTWSHAAALRAKRTIKTVANVCLEPLGSASELFEQVANNSDAAAIIPTYNLEQGIVYDFARFQLFEEIGSLELKTRMCLFGRAERVSDLKRIYTKDTVLPQVSHWLNELPNHIEIIARPDISTAGGVALAAAEEGAGAICSEAAGRAHQLRPLALGIANNRENYTAFSVFQRGNQFKQAEFLSSPPEYSFGIDETISQKGENGKLTVLWHISGVHNQSLHLGHMSAILSLHKLAKLGNKLVIQIEKGPFLHSLQKQLVDLMPPQQVEFQTAPDREKIYQPSMISADMRVFLEKRADIRGCDRVSGREAEKLKLTCNHQVLLYAVNASRKPHIDLVVAGPSLLPDLKMIAQHTGRIIPTILTDYFPGTDNYAKMSAKRHNQVDWTTNLNLDRLILPKKMLDSHFSADRLQHTHLKFT